jgi:hypothetical protein
VQAKGIENIFNKIIAESFPNLGEEMDIQVQEVFKTPNRQKQKRTSPCHTILTTLSIQNQERMLKAASEKHQVTYKKANPSE